MNRDDDIFGEALDLPPAERCAYLDRTCTGDPELRARVEALLAGLDQAGDFLEQSAVARAAPPPDEKPGDTIGRYTLVRKIGEGGCGSVYLAEQKMPVRRRVAFKIIKLGMDTRQVIARFEGERQALAMMDHPDIARVLDAGATETGRPFFVMEFVDGVPINRYCDEHKLTVAARLELFARVCLALQHAHQKGIIHRDVKPSNILITEVDGVPAPKVIDFGIAKATQDRLTEHTVLTGIGQFIGTPAYMSPEQADQRDLDIDTRSDVYALGVLLYELLAGRLPFDLRKITNSGIDEARRLICETEPPRPSARYAALAPDDRVSVAQLRATTPPVLLAALRDDLDWIAMRCLEKDRDRRYSSAQDLADDVRRHLSHEPVEARPPSTLYRSRRFVARHRVACASAAAIVLVMIAGTVVSVRQAVRATRAEHVANAQRDAANAASRAAAVAREDAQRRQQEAEDLLSFVIGTFRGELKNIDTATLDAIDGKVMAYFNGLDPRDLTDTVLARQAKALYQLGETQIEKANYKEADKAFSASFGRAAALVTRHPSDPDMLFERAQAEYWVGYVARLRGDYPTAREWLIRYRDSAIGLQALEGKKLRAQREVTAGHHNLAVLDYENADLVAAQAGFLAERKSVEEMSAANPEDMPLKFRLADVASWLGSVAEADGRYADAVTQFTESATRVEELTKLQPNVARWRLRLADSLALAGDARALLGERANDLFERARVLREALATQDPKNRQWQLTLLRGQLHQLNLMIADGDLATAATLAASVRDKTEALVKAEPTSTQFAATLTMAWRTEARLRLAAGRADAGEAADRAVAIAGKMKEEDRANIHVTGDFAQACVLAGRVAQAAGQAEEARRDWERALEAVKTRLPTSNNWYILEPAAQALVLLGRADEARPLIARLNRFGYHAFDPLAASTLGVAVLPSSSSTQTR